jgi:glycine cleavage system H lipoate-binding protein
MEGLLIFGKFEIHKRMKDARAKAKVGVTQYAKGILDVVFVELPKIGRPSNREKPRL